MLCGYLVRVKNGKEENQIFRLIVVSPKWSVMYFHYVNGVVMEHVNNYLDDME